MDFKLSEEQQALQEIARDFLRERWPTSRMRDLLDDRPAVIDEDVWKEIVEMGWLGVAVSEQGGGIGGDVMTAAVLVEEAGRGVLPGPLQSSLVAAIAIDRSGDDGVLEQLLSELLEGKTRLTLAILEPTGLYGTDALETSLKEDSGEWMLSGRKILVPDM